jgi:CheY-like chemotaxis protein
MKTTFLLVEDDAHDAALLKLALKDRAADISLQVVNNAVDATLYVKGEARFAARRKFPLPNVILLDIRMPLFDGFEFLAWLRNDAPVARRQTPVVVMSGSDRRQDIERAYELGANAYLIKPPAWSDLKHHFCSMASFWSLRRPRSSRTSRSTTRKSLHRVDHLRQSSSRAKSLRIPQPRHS